MLEHHRRMEQIVGVDHRAFSEQLLDPAAATLVPLIQVGGELAPVGLVLFEQGTELLVHRRLRVNFPQPAYLPVTAAVAGRSSSRCSPEHRTSQTAPPA